MRKNFTALLFATLALLPALVVGQTHQAGRDGRYDLARPAAKQIDFDGFHKVGLRAVAGAASSVSSAAFPLLAPNGSSAAPSYSFSSAPTVGFFLSGSNIGASGQISSTGASSGFNIDTNGGYAFYSGATPQAGNLIGYSYVLSSNAVHGLASGGSVRWSNSATDINTFDVGVKRNAAGVLEVNSGTAGTLRDLTLRKITATDSAITGGTASGMDSVVVKDAGYFGWTTDSQIKRYAAKQISITGDGTGATTNAGLIIGYLGLSGWGGIWNSALTPSTSNYAIAQNNSGTTNINGVTQLNLGVGNAATLQFSSTGVNAVLTPTDGSGLSGAAVASTNTTAEEVLATINIPALSAKSQIRIHAHFTCTNNANVKTVRARLGGLSGTIFFNPAVTSVAAGEFWGVIANRNATNSQFGNVTAGQFHGLGASGAGVTGAVDTSVATTLVLTSQKATGTDTLTLEWFLVEIIKL